jgi:hypothetical protein
MCVLIFYIIFVSNISQSTKKWARYDQKRVLVFMWSTCYSCQILMALNVLDRFSKNTHSIKFHENPSRGSRVVPCRRMDVQADMTKLTAAVSNFANAFKYRTLLRLHGLRWTGLLGARHDKVRVVRRRDGRVTISVRTTLFLNTSCLLDTI